MTRMDLALAGREAAAACCEPCLSCGKLAAGCRKHGWPQGWPLAASLPFGLFPPFPSNKDFLKNPPFFRGTTGVM